MLASIVAVIVVIPEPLADKTLLIFQGFGVTAIPIPDVRVPAFSLAGRVRAVAVFFFAPVIRVKKTTAVQTTSLSSSGRHRDHPLYEEGYSLEGRELMAGVKNEWQDRESMPEIIHNYPVDSQRKEVPGPQEKKYGYY